MFEASKSLAEAFDYAEAEEEQELTEADVPLLRLHQQYAFVQASKALLQLALMVRTYDDQMRDSGESEAYLQHSKDVDDGHYVGILNGQDSFLVREACNKIIHATEVRPLYERVDRIVTDALKEGKIHQDIWYLTGEIELSGFYKREEWNAVLHLQPFVEIILGIIEFGNP